MTVAAELKLLRKDPVTEQQRGLDRRDFLRRAIGLHRSPVVSPAQPSSLRDEEAEECAKGHVRELLGQEANRRQFVEGLVKAAGVAYIGEKQVEKGIKDFFRELLAAPETTANYTIDASKVAFAGNRLIFMSKIDGNPEEHLVIMDIDFLDTASSLGRDIGRLPLSVNSVSVLGDKLAAGGTQLNDPTKGLVWYSLHGGRNPIVLSSLRILSETGQTVAGPVQRVSIPVPPPGQWYLQNNVIFESSNPTDTNNIPINAGVLDTNTGVVTPLSGSPASYVEGNMLAIDSASAIAAGINYQNVYIQAGYTAFRLDLNNKTITSTVNTEEANNMWLEKNIIQYFRESDNKRITLAFNLAQNVMVYNIDDHFAFSVRPVDGGTPIAAAEGKNLYILSAKNGYDPVTHKLYSEVSLMQIDPTNGYDNVAKQKIIPLTDAGLPKGIREATIYIVRYQNGEIPVIVTDKGVWLINEAGNLMQVLVQKQPKNRIYIPIVINNALRTVPGW